jgi:hypothetical protein
MRGRALKWGGGLVALVTATWMGIYFAEVGLNTASQAAGVAGAFIGLAGLGIAVYGAWAAKTGPEEPGPPPCAATGDVVTNTVSNSINNGTIVQSGRVGPADPPAGGC